MFQISSEDLAQLEEILPKVFWGKFPAIGPVDRKRWRTVQTILSNVRWGYGPPRDIERVKDENEDSDDSVTQ